MPCLKVAVAMAEKRLQRSSQQSLVQCQNLSVSNASSSGKLDELKAESFYIGNIETSIIMSNVCQKIVVFKGQTN